MNLRAALPLFRLSAVTLAAATVGLTAAQNAGDDAAARVAAERARILEQYLIGPDAAASLGCEIAWQTSVPLASGGSLRLVESSPEAVLALDNLNEVTHIRPDNGGRVWTASAADPIDRVLGLGIYLHNAGADNDARRVSVITDAVSYGIGFDSGATLARSRFRHVPNTTPVQYGGVFIYGTSSGQVSWFNCATGNDSRGAIVDAFTSASPIDAMPAVARGIVVAGSNGGGVAALNADTGRLLWNRKLLGPVSAAPAIGGSTAFVASDDQYLYAFDLVSGTPLWKYFTQTPLRTSPFVAGELVLQDVPGEGLLALTQRPESQPGGEVRWRRESVHGHPIGMLGGDVVFWCGKGRMVTVISLKDGQTIRTVELPLVEHLEADTIEAGGFLAWSKDGRVERLTPGHSASGK